MRSYDLRGRVGADLTVRDARALGLRIAAAVLERGGRTVAVGHDGRLSSPMLEAAVVDGLVAGGVEAWRTGLGPTGQLYFAVHALELDGGVMVTGSHNPSDENGFKILLGIDPVHGSSLQALVGRSAAPALGGGSRAVAIQDAYLARLLQAAHGAPALRIGWDAGNGATGRVVERLTERLPGEHHLIHCRIDGRFPAHHPDPSDPANLADLRTLVREHGLDLGIAFDGDGDRIGVVDAHGGIVWPDQLLLYLAQDVLTRHPGAAVVADVKSSRVLFDGIAEAGGRGVLSPSGYVLIREAMLREGAPVAGEMSGHLFFAEDWYGTDDALHNAVRLLGVIGRRGSLTTWREALPRTHATPELRLPCPDVDKPRVLAGIEQALLAEGAAIDRTDGLRVTTPEGWWLLRASGTEPKLTARVEAWTAEGLERLRGKLMGHLRGAGVDVGRGEEAGSGI
ncbi:phosphomannomutase/phosphoglucomutase [uncultured Sphingomonas sp.]|uniref:phosphomannomutase/phosphoglucomutase n=1 Tax=uncultured Sphingomonas sp. TaxID=158754 RepID=UPI0035CA0B16